ncbi:MAG: MFS transporter [Candidatus Izemoplasmatales bacterium]|nr:MFS transporter [Candidatus Izemoplasmatales bacterium]
MKLNAKKVFYVGLAFFLISMFWQTYDSVITKILIDKFGLNQTWSGVVMALDNVLALFLLPLFGSLSDKNQSKRGRRTPYIIVGTIVAAFAFVALSYTDYAQSLKIESDTTIEADYHSIQVADLTVTDWQSIISVMDNERTAAVDSGLITPADYTTFTNDVYSPMNTLISDSNVSSADTDQLKDYYYSYLSGRAWELTTHNPSTFIVFAILLFIALLAMATFRSPAVALMPDVVIKPLRSKANAIINLLGTFGGILSIVILTLFGLNKLSYVNYAPAFITVGILMLVFLAIFLWKVKEPKLVAQREADDIKYGLTEENEAVSLHESMEDLSKEKRRSLFLILISVFLWFIGYNAVTTKLSDYAPKVLNLGYATPILIAQGAALLAFVPIGIIATKIGRKKTILIGITILTICFGSVYFLSVETAGFMYVIFALTGIGWATINVNSYPMVVELSKGSNVGKYTGYYYTFSMAAQILTPILSGILMDQFSRKILFPYATLFVALAFITMLFVKHGDAAVIKKDSVLENFDVDMD